MSLKDRLLTQSWRVPCPGTVEELLQLAEDLRELALPQASLEFGDGILYIEADIRYGAKQQG